MKKKKILGSIFAGLFAITSIGALASCGEKKPSNEDNQGDVDTNVDLQKVEAALNALSVSGTKNENFTLPTTAAGDVAISWASDKPEVVAISGGNATVTRPGFGAQNVTVKVTATAVSKEVSKTKEFTITVEAIADESKTVAEIKALAKDTVTYAHGVVSGFLWGLNKSNEEEKKGFYLTDATGTIYVFGTQTAAQVNVGDEVYFEGKKDEYNSVAQIGSPDKLTKLNEGQTPDFTAITTDKTVKEIAASENIGGNVYEFVAKVSQNAYGSYSLDDLAGYEEGTLSVYFSGSSSMNLVNYGAELKGKVNQIVKVRFVVNSQNSSKKWRGNILGFAPFTAEEQKTYASDAAKGLINLNSQITEAAEVNLPTAMEGFDKATIAWGFKTDTQAATIADNKLTITPTNEPQSFVLVATITIEGVADPIVVEFDQIDVCTSFEPMDYATYMEVENKKYIKVKGYVNILSTKNTFITDEFGNGYYLYDAVADVELGDEIIVTGTKSIYEGLHEINKGFTVEKTGNKKTITPVNVTEDITANGFTVTTTNQNKYVTFEGVLTAAKEVTVGENKVALFYKGNITEPEIGTKVKVTGIYSVFDTTSQIQVWSADGLVDQSTDAEKVEKVVLAIKNLFKDEDYISDAEVSFAKLPYAATLVVNVEGSTLAYDEVTKVVTITPVTETTADTLKITVTIGEVTSEELTITVNGKKAEGVKQLNSTIAYPGGSTTNMSGEDEAEALGANTTYLTIVGNKGGASNNVGLNTAGQFRLYANKNDGNGNTLTISTKDVAGSTITITSIDITFGGTVGDFTINNVTGSKETTTYEINSNQVVIKNTTTGTTTQVWILSIVVHFTVTESTTASENPAQPTVATIANKENE